MSHTLLEGLLLLAPVGVPPPAIPPTPVDVIWARMFTIGPVYSHDLTAVNANVATMQGIMSIGSGRVVAVYDEAYGGLPQRKAPQRLFSSLNFGVLWREIFPHLSASRFEGDANPFAWVGTKNPIGTLLADQAISRTDGEIELGGVMRFSSVVPGLGLADLWDTRGFVNFGNGELLAYGRYTIGTLSRALLRSFDSGAHWVPEGSFPAGLTTPIESGGANGSVVIVGSGRVSPQIYRSTDRGATWTGIDLPGHPADNQPTELIHLHDGIWLACQGPSIWRSTDNGVSWGSAALSTVPAFVSFSGQPTAAIVQLAYSGGLVIAGVSLDPTLLASQKSHWIASADDGVTWKVCTVATPVPASDVLPGGRFGSVRQVIPSGDGHFLCTIHRDNAKDSQQGEIWRGIGIGTSQGGTAVPGAGPSVKLTCEGSLNNGLQCS